MEYDVLNARVRAAGLYERTYGSYIAHTVAVFLGIIAVWYGMRVMPDSFLATLLLGICAGFVLVQAGMVGHDLSHLQVFASRRVNRVCSLIMWTFVCGLSERGWYDKHNAHHKHVNHVGQDPDLEIPFVFSTVQIDHKPQWVRRFVLPHQSWLFFVMLPLVYPNFVIWSILNVFTQRDRRALLEGILIALHFILFFGVPFFYFSPLLALVFIVTTLSVVGMYMGMVFAPNHKGEEVIERTETTWKDQILLTRNIRSNPFTFFVFGGLDLQVEHHLFPNMSRYNYPRAQVIVKQFCREAGIEYYETSWWGSMCEIYTALKRESDAWKRDQRR